MSDSHGDADKNSDLAVREADPVAREGLREPARFAVLLHNDNYTAMEFVIEVLVRFFKKSEEEATLVMLKVHTEGRGLAGVYSQEIADMKAAKVMTAARARGYPLRCSTEPQAS